MSLQLVDLIEDLRDRRDQLRGRPEDAAPVFLPTEQRGAGRFDFQHCHIVCQLIGEQEVRDLFACSVQLFLADMGLALPVSPAPFSSARNAGCG
ncbi:hypothetical protein NKJ81_22530 [Mesorhizobium sp. M0018]